ncbi:MAG: hypothetical protein GX548_01360 [Lentisphaerae bacterium]|nr:hypothetical protein [Lentisphaerota bacterium]
MKRMMIGLLLASVALLPMSAARAVECTATLENGQPCGALLWRCNQCFTDGCDDRDCPDTLQSAHAQERECRVCGSNDWSPLPEPEPAAEPDSASVE